MDKLSPKAPPFFDSQELRQELTQIWRQSQGNEQNLRSQILERLVALKQQCLQDTEENLIESGDGRACAEGLSLFQDELIRVLFDFTKSHIYRPSDSSSAEKIAIIATGGYGRGRLAPGSDLDLLFLQPYKQTAWGESVIEYMLYLLWDLGYKVGHATRNIEQSIKYAKQDLTIRTALLDARFLWGEKALFDQFEEHYKNKVLKGTAKQFIEEKLLERQERHQRAGTSRYMVEPNIKDGKGGLRDLHTLHWIVKYLNFQHNDLDTVSSNIFSAEEYHSFCHAEDFLWTIRCHLHFVTNRAEERLSFDVQKVMAERLGYTEREGLQAVERFMKHYFLIAKDVGNLTRVLCADLELKQLKAAPKLNQLLEGLTWSKRSQLRKSTDFKIENGRINIAHPKTFIRDPLNMLRIFQWATKLNTYLHPNALRAIRQSLRLVDEQLRNHPKANEIFFNLLTSQKNPEVILSRMNECGLLGRFVPEFGQITSMMQFNMYHHFTVDEHLIQAVGILAAIDRGELIDELPLSTEFINELENKHILYVAVFLHDIAKGRKEDHSIAGEQVAYQLAPRFGLDREDTQIVAWLIRQHLTMSQFAQSRDLNDPQTIRDFAKIVGNIERLKLLMILTVVDIRAVGPGVWNGWKGQLLRTLYFETVRELSGEQDDFSRQEQIDEAINNFKEALDDWPTDDENRFIEKQYPNYWLRTDLKTQVDHATLIRRAEAENIDIAFDIKSSQFIDHTQITVYSPNHPKLLSMVAGACTSVAANIIDAQVITTQDGMAFNVVGIQREFEENRDEKRRAENITEMIEKLIRGEAHLNDIRQQKRKIKGRMKAFHVEPSVRIKNDVSNVQTVLEVRGLDRPGLLFDLTYSLGELNLEITSAHVSTYGEKAVDVFYVTDLLGKKITSSERREQIKETLLKQLNRK